ncbi:MAG: TraB/GumN family protein [Flavobacteriales bacterium]|nr:TraB/GumN family protein [Flavobacteriales bacterium]
MKKSILVLLLVLANSLFSQEKYQGLLWEVSGNGLKKSTYLYGTMHISGRLAFHLGEEFFVAIKSVDAIALESNPILWLDEIVDSEFANDYLGYYSIQRQNYKGFYQEAFKIKVLDNLSLSNSISSDHYLTNWLLYRSNKSKSDFEEETFLDMFIYQAGSKYNKPVYSLESFQKTSIQRKLSAMPDMEKKEIPEWYTEMTKEKSAYEILYDAYRNKNLNMLDSIQSATTSDNYLKYMLYDRNIIMADNIDSIVQAGTSIFIGIGAAHLPKEKGVIELLRSKGYTVEAMSTTITPKAKKEKDAFSKMKKMMPVKNEFKSDLFSLMIPGTMYETPALPRQRQFFSPELTNGTFYWVNQLSTYDYFNGLTEINYLERIDSLLFENIPGKIISKTPISKAGFQGIDIVNKTKTGNYQRYQMYLTPLQILIFKMGGNDDFAKKHSDDFFDNIKLKGVTKNWKVISPIKTDFEIKVPDYYNIKNNNKITSLYGHTEIEAYDKKDTNYYFLKRSSLFDMSFIEEDDFELNRILDKFCEEMDIDSVDKEIQKDADYPTVLGYTRTKDGLSYLSLKVVIKGAYYYLMANVSPTYKKTNPFFDSFKLTDFSYTFDFKEKVDTLLYFKVNSNYLTPGDYKQVVTKAYDRKSAKKETEDIAFKSSSESQSYYSENYERIDVDFVKLHRYKHYKNIDSLYNREIRYLMRKNSLVLKDKVSEEENGTYTMDANFIDTNSVRTIKTRFILKDGAFYTLQTTSDSTSKPSKFIEQFYETFTPIEDTVMGVSPLIDKSVMFFKAINGTDSLEKERALKSVVTHVVFEDENVPELLTTISNYPFPEKYIEAKEQMIRDLGIRNNPKIVPYLENMYANVEDTAMYQIAILKSLIRQKSKNSYTAFLKLLEYDIPLGSQKSEVSSMINLFEDSLEIGNQIFPDILNYTFVADYKKAIYSLLATLVDSNQIKPKQYAKYYKQILREAKIELKSQISYEQTERAQANTGRYYYSSYKNKGNNLLVNYTTLLIPFCDKKDVKEYFSKLERVEDYDIRTDINCKLVRNNITVKPSEWKALADDNINFSY